jgi:benzylsuccinate CoA-transferase BbsF subunit
VTSVRQWRALVATINHKGLTDITWEDESIRADHRLEIDTIVAAWVADQQVDTAMEILQAAGVPAGKVQDTRDLVERDMQHRERKFWQSVTHEVFGERGTDTFPALWDGERLAVERLSPAYLGEHNFEVWTELAGLDMEQVAEGMSDGLFT